MRKTPIEIEKDFVEIIRESKLGKNLRGGVFPDGERPKGSRNEDAIVCHLTGRDTNPQTGTIVVRIYVPEQYDSDGQPDIDKTRVGGLQKLVLEMMRSYRGEYWFDTDGSMSTAYHSEIEQHCLIVRLNYSRVAF